MVGHIINLNFHKDFYSHFTPIKLYFFKRRHSKIIFTTTTNISFVDFIVLCKTFSILQ